MVDNVVKKHSAVIETKGSRNYLSRRYQRVYYRGSELG